ncbi:DUF4124 domain-containing protein [Dongshaea marina]|uniref:DUF4124 domain-containing protein n=1 Tax=Dongshaea marina TaxID=2047966 RepID=UPI000D3E1B9E|nr:DUF4124 domain-containing protein [Dongshaea marina]
MNRFSIALLITLLLPYHLVCANAIYKWVDKQGVTHFTDTPVSGAEKTDVRPSIAANIPKVISEPVVEQAKATSYQLSLLQPKDQTTIRNNQGNIAVTSKIAPMPKSYRMQVFVDGALFKEIKNQTSVLLSNVERGEHQIQTKLLSDDGVLEAESPVVTVYLHRTSIHAPARTPRAGVAN